MLTQEQLASRLTKAVRHFWRTRGAQARKQVASGRSDQGSRGSVTGGKQMDGFLALICKLICDVGVTEDCIHTNSRVELPGYFRAEKKWDLLVVKDDQLLVALEAKSQSGSFGNNFNNRTEEAMGSALDVWTAYREGAFNSKLRPWLGYIFLLEDCPRSRKPVRVYEPHFSVFPEFVDASYAIRYELFCRKLVRERHYDQAALLLSPKGRRGEYSEPADDLTLYAFARGLTAHVAACV